MEDVEITYLESHSGTCTSRAGLGVLLGFKELTLHLQYTKALRCTPTVCGGNTIKKICPFPQTCVHSPLKVSVRGMWGVVK